MGNSLRHYPNDGSPIDPCQIMPEKTDRRDEDIVQTPIADTEEGNSEIYYDTGSLTNIASLPDEMVFEILLHLSAEHIYSEARFVCQKWYNTTNTRNFIHEHLRRSTPGLVIKCGNDPMKQPITVSMRRGRIEISKFSYELKGLYWYGCDGLFLHRDSSSSVLYITNPATNRHFALPESVSSTSPYSCSFLAYASTSMAYKLVQTYNCPDKIPIVRDCAVLTVGVDQSRRLVHTQHLSTAARQLLKYIPLTIEGFIHWTKKPQGTDRVVTLNVETEVITETRLPVDYGSERLMYYLSTGASLTLLVECSEFSWGFWNLKSETGEWAQLPDIDLESQKGKLVNFVSENRRRCSCPVNLRPVGWLNHGEVLVLHGSRFSGVCVLYNVRTQAIDFFMLEYECITHMFDSHRSSLVSLD
ncbi:hypothetical protein ABFS83_01G057600 [Erythranthe nasuta]